MSKRAAIYIRQSSTSEGTVSPFLQEKNVRQMIEREGWEAGEVYSDIDISGLKEDNRPSFLKLKADYAAGKFDIAVADDFSRFSRNREDAMILLGNMRIATAKEGVPDEADSFMPALYFLLADKFSRDMSKRWRDALMKRLSEGLPPSGKNHFGYRKEGKTAYILHEPEAEILREAYRRYTAGEGAFTICSDFNRRELPAAGSRGWYTAGFFDLLDKRFNVGQIEWRQKKGDEPLVAPGAHEPIVSPGQYAAYRQAREQRRNKVSTHNPTWWLSGLVICGRCGSQMGSHRSKGEWSTQCLTYSHKGKSECPGVFLKRKWLDFKLEGFLLTNLEAFSNGLPSNEAELEAAELAVLDNRAALADAENEYTRYQRFAFENGILPKVSAAELTRLAGNVEEKQAELDKALAHQATIIPQSDYISRLASVEKLGDSEQLAARRTAVQRIVEKIVVNPRTTANHRDPTRDRFSEIEVVVKPEFASLVKPTPDTVTEWMRTGVTLAGKPIEGEVFELSEVLAEDQM